MDKRTLALLLTLALTAAGTALADSRRSGWGSQQHEPGRNVVEIEDARLKFDINATDEDGGVQVFLDAEPWRWMSIFDPRGRLVFSSLTAGSIGKNGGTELFLESGEPEFSELPLNELLERYPAGEYRFLGHGIDAEKLVGSATLTHDLPD